MSSVQVIAGLEIVTVPSADMLEATGPSRHVDDGFGNSVGRGGRFEHFSLLHLRPIFPATESGHGHESHMRGKAAQGQACSRAL